MIEVHSSFFDRSRIYADAGEWMTTNNNKKMIAKWKNWSRKKNWT